MPLSPQVSPQTPPVGNSRLSKRSSALSLAGKEVAHTTKDAQGNKKKQNKQGQEKEKLHDRLHGTRSFEDLDRNLVSSRAFLPAYGQTDPSKIHLSHSLSYAMNVSGRITPQNMTIIDIECPPT